MLVNETGELIMGNNEMAVIAMYMLWRACRKGSLDRFGRKVGIGRTADVVQIVDRRKMLE